LRARRRAFGKLGSAGRALALLLPAGLTCWSCEPLDIALFPPDAARGEVPVDVTGVTPLADAGPAGGEAAAADAGAAVSEPCLESATRCEACISSGNCPAGRVCHPRSGDCVVPCASSEPRCPAATVCSPLGVCVACLDSVQCPSAAARVCDTDRGVCVECVNDTNCTTDPLRLPVCLPGLNRCGCDSNDDCSGGFCEVAERHCELDDD
jgi:hypothetical protein